MGIKVRLRPMELTTGVEYEYYPKGTHYIIHEDNTLEIQMKTSEGRLRKIGHVHPHRWDAVHNETAMNNAK